jgi:hypothetical protein
MYLWDVNVIILCYWKYDGYKEIRNSAGCVQSCISRSNGIPRNRDIFGLLLCGITLEGTVERKRKRLLFELTPTTWLSEKICNPLDGGSLESVTTPKSIMQSGFTKFVIKTEQVWEREGDNSSLIDVALHEVRNSPSTYATYIRRQ